MPLSNRSARTFPRRRRKAGSFSRRVSVRRDRPVLAAVLVTDFPDARNRRA
jgi:hypothetical protein